MWERILQRLKGRNEQGNGKRPLKETMLIIFLSGILLFVILLPTGQDNGSSFYKSSTKEKKSSAQSTDITRTQEASGDSYKRTLEQELESFLSSIEGVGKVKVLIYMKESQKYIVEKDVPTSSSKDGESSQESKEETTVYTRNDSGNEVPFVNQTKSPAIDGVVIAAEGAINEEVRLQIVRLVMALYGVEANKVEVGIFVDTKN